MPDESEYEPNPRDDGGEWGHIEKGEFRPLSKRNMLDAEYGPPPFDITLPSGEVRGIVSRPVEAAAPAPEDPPEPEASDGATAH